MKIHKVFNSLPPEFKYAENLLRKNLHPTEFKQWVENIKKHCFGSWKKRLLQSCDEHDGVSLIIDKSFPWDETIEGHEFWHEIADKYETT